jgi:hypothetical protein
MHTRYLCWLISLLLFVALTSCTPTQQHITPTTIPVDPGKFPDSAVPYPVDYRTNFIRFLTIDRIDATVRDLYINPEALDELRQGRPLPENTIFVIEAYHAEMDENGSPVTDTDGRYIKAAPFDMIHVAERRSNWTDADFPSVVRAGRWNFGSFDVNSGSRFDEDLAACFNCHQAMANTDFLYSTEHLLTYLRTGEPQYMYCNLRQRVPC